MVMDDSCCVLLHTFILISFPFPCDFISGAQRGVAYRRNFGKRIQVSVCVWQVKLVRDEEEEGEDGDDYLVVYGYSTFTPPLHLPSPKPGCAHTAFCLSIIYEVEPSPHSVVM